MANYSCSQKKKTIIFPQEKNLKGYVWKSLQQAKFSAFAQQMAYSVFIYVIIYSLVNPK